MLSPWHLLSSIDAPVEESGALEMSYILKVIIAAISVKIAELSL